MGKRLLAGFLTMCLLLGGCSADRESSTSLEGGPPRQEEVSREKPEFVKVKYAYFEDPEDPQRYYEGFYALDSAGEPVSYTHLKALSIKNIPIRCHYTEF